MIDIGFLAAAGLTLYNAGHLPDAARTYRRILVEDCAHADGLHFLGIIACRTGRYDEAERWLRRAIAVDRHSPDLHNSLGIAINAQGRPREAMDCFRTAMDVEHGFAPSVRNLSALFHNTGGSLVAAGRFAEAQTWLEASLTMRPNMAEGNLNLGVTLDALGKPANAYALLRRATILQPDFAAAHNAFGVIARKDAKVKDAEERFRRALSIQPQLVDAYNNLGSLLKDASLLEPAAACYRRALAIRPNDSRIHSNLLVTLPLISGANGAALFAEACRFGARVEEPFRRNLLNGAEHGNDRDPERRLRVGYLSPSLCAHVLAPYIEPVLRAHRRDHVDVHVYAHVPNPDAMTWRIKDAADSWTFVQNLSDEAVAEQIRRDRIDILVEPMGHWADNRLPVFARKPAPIQVSYLCQGMTTGLSSIDYIIGDRWLNADGAMQRLATERVVMLQNGFQICGYDQEPPVGEPPCAATGFVTFGSFNNPAKLSDESLRLWKRVLDGVAGARLLIKGKGLEQPPNRHRLATRLAEQGIPVERCAMLGLLPGRDYLAAYNRIDIALDTTPFTGGRTTIDALWMGVPVVTLVGDTVHGRFSHSHLMRAGFPELVAPTADRYVEIAGALADDLPGLRRYRTTLRAAIRRSSLHDAPTHVAELEEAYRMMWRRWCADLPPESFIVPSESAMKRTPPR